VGLSLSMTRSHASSWLRYALAMLLLVLHVAAAQQIAVEVGVPDVLSTASMASVNSDGSSARPTSPATTSVQVVASTAPALFNLTQHTQAAAALRAYAEWHNRTLADSAACSKAPVLVWEAMAGWGDSVNALTSSFRHALVTSRLFFIRWQSKNDKHLWKTGLQMPDFHWDYEDTLTQFPGCRLSLKALRQRSAHERPPNSKADDPLPRVLAISGTIVASHPLANALSGWYDSGRCPVIWSLGDGALQRFLLRPNAALQSWLDPVVAELQRDRPADFAGVIGLQLRSGYADAPDRAKRPSNANFLAQGDERLFLDKVEALLRSTRFGADPRRARVFLTTDSPDVRDAVEKALRSERFSAKALAGASAGAAETPAADGAESEAVGQTASAPATSGLHVVSVQSGSVSHCGPHRNTDPSGVLRMLSEWFVLSRHVDVPVLTAWSLFGASAVEGHKGEVHRIDASNCGQTGAKPCQNGFA